MAQLLNLLMQTGLFFPIHVWLRGLVVWLVSKRFQFAARLVSGPDLDSH